MSKLKQIFQEVRHLIQDGRYAEDIIHHLQAKYRMPREGAYKMYMDVHNTIPPEIDDDF